MISSSFDSHRRVPVISLLLLFGIALFWGCGSSTETNFRPYDGTRFLPTTQTIPEPDTLQDVELRMGADSVQIVLKESYASLTEKWSAQIQRDAASTLFQPGEFSTYATLMSREMTLASLERAERLRSLRPEAARDRIEETLTAYDDVLKFRVHLYLNAAQIPAPLSTLRQKVVATLRVNRKETYNPIRTKTTGVRVEQRSQIRVYHYPLTVLFERTQEGRDLLTETAHLELSVRPFPATTELFFQWERESPPS